MRALLYLLRRSGRNRIVRAVRRLKNPKYAIGAIVGVAYLVFAFSPSVIESGNTARLIPLEEAMRDFLPVPLFLLAAWWWIFGGSKFVLAFSPSEVQLLFTAPLSRRRLLLYRVMRAQGPLFFTAIIWAIFFRFGALDFPLRFLSLWAILSVLHLHQMAAHLTRTQAQSVGLRRFNLSGVVLVSALTVCAVVGWSIVTGLGSVMSPPPDSSVFGQIAALATAEPTATLLAPFRLLLRPLFAETISAWALALLPAVVLGVAHLVWVVQSGVAFEEQAAAAGLARLQARRALQQGRWTRSVSGARKSRTRSASLKPEGIHVMAIVWKNWYAFFRNLGGKQFLLTLIVIGSVIGALVANGGGDGPVLDAIAFLALLGVGLSMLMGSQFLRNDLRADLMNVELLRTYPVNSGALVGAELASSAVILLLIQFALIIVAGVLAPFTEFLGPTPAIVWQMSIPAIFLLPALNMITVGAANAVAVLFPGWVSLGLQATVGVQALGQRLVNMFALIIFTIIALVPAGLMAAAVSIFLQPLGPWAMVAGFVVLVAVLWAQVVLISLLIAWAYNRLDPVESGLLN